jgi:hypothetical protein
MFLFVLQIQISTTLNTIVGMMNAADLERKYMGPPSSTDVRIEEMHTLMGNIDGKINVLLAGQKVDGGKAPPE